MNTLIKIKQNLIRILVGFCAVLLILVMLQRAFAGEEKIAVDEGSILSFERDNPVYSLEAFKGTEFGELGFPESLGL